MNIILNTNNKLRMSNYSEGEGYYFEDIFFYIPKVTYNNLSAPKNVTVSFSANDTVKTYKLYLMDENKNYYIFKVFFTKVEGVAQGTYETTINVGESKSAPLDIILLNKTYKPTQESFIEQNPIMKDIVITNDINVSYSLVSGSKFLTFTLPREFNGTDLGECDSFLTFVKPDGTRLVFNTFKDYYQTVSGDASKIKVPWSIKDDILDVMGITIFSLCFKDIAEDGYFVHTVAYVADIANGEMLNIHAATGREENYKQFELWQRYYQREINVSLIDANPYLLVENKAIVSMNTNVIVQGDNRSQLISFKVHRFQDNIDLSKKIGLVKYRNAAGGFYKARIVNAYVEDESFIFSWLITSNVTAAAGQVPYSIEFVGDLTRDDKDYYVWQTIPSSIVITDGMGDITFQPEEMPDWYSILSDKIELLEDKVSSSYEDSLFIYPLA